MTAAGAVGAGHEVTARAAAQILVDGGNAFDAAIAALWAACVCEPVLASPAGGGFLVARPAGGSAEVFDFFVATPLVKAPLDAIDFRAAHADFGTAVQEFHIGAGAVAAPGFVPGLFAVHAAHASVPMPDLAAPAARAARLGVRLSALQADVCRIVAPIITDTPAARALFAPEGVLLAEGQTVRNPALADTIAALARDGPGLIAEGPLGQAIIAEIESRGGHLTAQDLAAYRVERREPLVRDLGGATLAVNPPPAAGGAMVALILALAEGVDGPAAVRLASAIDAAESARRSAAAPDDPGLAAAIAAISAAPAPRGTTHVSVVDAAGNTAAATVTNGEGNGQVVGGFLLNNMLGEEILNPAGFHLWEPGVRPSSMMAPAVLARGDEVIALGSGGSNRIASAVAGVVARLLDGEPLARAIAAPRAHVEHGHLDFEDQLPQGERAALVARFTDHRAWDRPSVFFGGVHAARRAADGLLEAFGDPRRSGVGMLAGP